MRWRSFSLAVACLAGAVLPIAGQELAQIGPRVVVRDSVVTVVRDSVVVTRRDSVVIVYRDAAPAPSANDEVLVAVPPRPHRLDRRLHRGRAGWERIIPTHLKLQFAGGMGMLSGGIGWDYGKLCRWETDLYLGYLPRTHAERDMVTLTLKQNYIPWSIACGRRFAVEPFYCGVYLNTIFGPQFWVKEPDRYPHGYYTFSTKIRSHVFVGQRFVWYVNGKGWVKNLTAYYEVSTCDLYLISALKNRYLDASDIISLSFGLKMQIF